MFKTCAGNLKVEGPTFKTFPLLPPELRQHIWSIAASSPTPGVCIFLKNGGSSYPAVHEPHNRALLATNTEARHVALMAPRTTRNYNPEIDILYIPRRSLNAYRATLFGPAPLWSYKTRCLALPSTEMWRVLDRPDFLLRLPCLETLSIVFPTGSGPIGYFQDVALPAEEGSMRFRRLTQEDLTGIMVRADYMHGTYPIRWARSGVKYLEWAKSTLDKSGRVMVGREVFPLWDHQAGRVRIRYEGRCFEALPEPERFDM